VAAPRITSFAVLFAACGLAFVPGGARAGDTAGAYRTWQDCLGHAYVTGIAYTGRDLAADGAIRACRGEESAYLTALSASPLLDGDDIAQARPDLIARARSQLLATVTAGPRAVLR
jgi:hypothetical protein